MISLLLLDLDGVVVHEMAPPHVKQLELILLHDLRDNALQALGVPVVVLTHRSRAEAAVILASAGLGNHVADLLAAEDILSAAFAHGTPWQLLRKGLRKSWVLPVVERRYQIDRKNVAFIDDRLDNIEDLVHHGIGIALHAPAGIDEKGNLISFDFQEAMRILCEWDEGQTPHIVAVSPRIIMTSDFLHTGVSTKGYTASLFNRGRRFGRLFRKWLWSRSAV